jgi:D-mycarose 3-C-methyltransferase
LAHELLKNRKPNAIIANNVVGHIEELIDFMQGVNILLEDDGVFVFEVPYLIDMLENIDYGNVYHEHKSYFSILSLNQLMDKLGLRIFDIEKQEVHGGTIRVFVCKKGAYKVRSVVGTVLNEELDYDLHAIETYQEFAHGVKLSRASLLREITRSKKQGKRIFGYGASAKGNVLLNYCGINVSTVDFVTDTTPLKQGLYTSGTHIPIRSPEIMKNAGEGDVALMLAWDYQQDILEKEAEFRKRGGLFLIPVPHPRLL